MKIIDLSQPLFDGMEVFPGDPEVKIKQVHDLDKEGWRLRYLQFSSHIGTHVDAPAHMDENGETIDNLPIERYMGETVIAKIEQDLPKNIGLAFRDVNLEIGSFEKIREANPRFVIVGDKAEVSVELERKLLQAGIITITNLVNMDKLPTDKPFNFFGVPLKIKDGDGSPIRAFAVII